MADNDDDKVATTRNTGKAAAKADEDGRKAVTLTSATGTKVTAPARSVDRLKRMGFK